MKNIWWRKKDELPEKALELSAFVKNTIVQIIDGISEIKEHANKAGAVINPSTLDFVANGVHSKCWCEETGLIATEIEFDLAVTSSYSASGDATISVLPSVLKIGANTKSNHQDVNKVKFSIMTLMPTSEQS